MRGPRRLLLGVAAVLFVGQAVASLLAPAVASLDIARDVIPFLIPLVAAAAALIAAHSRWREDGLFWLFLGLGSLAWALGDIGFSVYDLIAFDPSGRLTLADVGYLALIPLWGLALLVHPSRSRRGIDRLGTTIDALTVMAFAATLTTAYVLVPALRDAGDFAGAIVSTAYPLGDLALLAVLVSIIGRGSERMRAGDAYIAVAAAIFAVGDIFYARLSILGTYDVGHPVDLTWSLSFVCVALAAGHALAGESPEQGRRRPGVPVLAIVGTLGIAALATLAMTSPLRERALLFGAVITGLLVMTRLVVLLTDRARLVRSLDDSVAQLKEAHVARERFIATVSHDLRSPLATVAGYAQLLQEPDFNADPTRVAQFASSIERNARHLAHLTEDLLCAGQFAAGHPPHLDLAPIDLREVIEQVLSDTGRTDGVAVDGRSDTRAVADRARLQQIITNLVENAFKHSGSTDVRVRIGIEDANPFIEVSDAGVGIAPERVKTIFDPFVSDFTHRSSVGLGLYVVWSLVAAMGGKLSVASEVGRGTTFRVILPAACPATVTGATHVAAI